MRLTKQHAPFRLYDVGAAILLFGLFAQQPELKQSASTALAELAKQGYQIPDEYSPVRIIPALTDGRFSSRHAGAWRPGSIYLRAEPDGNVAASVYLRHELFHEASYRTCFGRLPIWAEELAAMRFSGELQGEELQPPTTVELTDLKQHIEQHRELDNADLHLLRRLAANTVWSLTPCAIPEKLARQLENAFEPAGHRAYVLLSLATAKIIAAGGNLNLPEPPGSLLKIPYAAALRTANPESLGKELLASDTDKLLERRDQLQTDQFRRMLIAIKSNRLLIDQPKQIQDWRAFLGERSSDGSFAVQATLPELALTLRASLLSAPEKFQVLSQNGIADYSTLFGQAASDKKVLQRLQALAKTGTVSNTDGQPQLGHLLVAWPTSHPAYLAIFRQQGVRGAAILPWAAPMLAKWQQDYPSELATVRVRLLTLTPRESWQAITDCPEFSGPNIQFSLCGRYRIVSTAYGSRSERIVNGILHESTKQGPVVLETDLSDYIDAVIDAEAPHLTGNARSALRAVIAWNGSHGQHRHHDSESLCDTSHCMLFLGNSPNDNKSNRTVELDLMKVLDRLAADKQLNWLPFALGGDQRWQLQINASTLQTLFKEDLIMTIRREHRKNGERFVRLYYPEHEEILSCEVFRNTLKLPSCPEHIQPVPEQNAWLFEGLGAGHGLGLSVSRAQTLAEQGHSAEQILLDAYR